ncbi:hypothetical protein BIY26_13060 [Brenneria goodwinii]|uniref:Uncharacterized protein n=1 Tax=Brenneria goodwinii TaxID=1109412 RepID=A0AAE8JMG5_9GAMM|nr:hypothetical protein AWC36_17345 [Brenneria goodwinii]RLM22381.1 hypothetical protein BIY26_13060 [Brenneria goodwinii]
MAEGSGCKKPLVKKCDDSFIINVFVNPTPLLALARMESLLWNLFTFLADNMFWLIIWTRTVNGESVALFRLNK